MAVPQVIWTDHRRRLVVIEGDTPQQNKYFLEMRAGDKDAMGKPQWHPTELSWELFLTILQSVAAWKPVELNPDEMQ